MSGPSVTFYREATVNYRLPTIANADAAHDVSYAVTPALPAGYSLNSSTAAITGSRSRSTDAVARSNYTLRATDGFSRTADLTFSLEVKTDGGIESVTITSNSGMDRTYGKTSDFGPNDTIGVRVDFTHRLGTVLNFDDRLCLSIRIGANTRRPCNPTTASGDKLDFSYAVQESGWDGDGISFPGNPLSVTGPNSLRFDSTAISNTAVNVNFGAIPDDPNHKVRGRQTTPTFGTTASPACVWITDDAVSQELPAATDGDKAELRFSIRIDDIAVSISSPSVSEGAAPATLTFAVTLNRAAGRTVTVAYGVDGTDPGTATAGTDYTTVAGGTLTFGAADTSRTFDVAVTDDRINEPDETVRITLRNPSGAGLGTATGIGTITDDDTAALTVSGVTGQATEAQGATATAAVFDVALATEPTGPVTVAVTSQKETEGVAAPANLTFGTASWNTAQTVTGVDDAVDDGNQSYAVHLDPAGEAADAYTALATHMSTMVTTVDDDTAGLGVDTDGAQTTLTLYEDPQHTANAAAYPVRLTAEPGGGVTVSVTVTGDTDAVGVAPANLTFAAATWNTAQTVTATVSVRDDDGGLDVGTVSGNTTEAGGTATFAVTLLSTPRWRSRVGTRAWPRRPT